MSRESILQRVRSALKTGTPTRSRAVAGRLAIPPNHPRPAFARTEGPEREARLVRCLEGQGTQVISIADLAALPLAMAEILSRAPSDPKLGGASRLRLVIGGDQRLTALTWPDTVPYEIWRPDETLGDGTAALTHAWGAVAETGTLVMASSPASPASLAFLPEVHIVAVARADIAASFEEAFTRLGRSFAHRLPRAVNLVSGASRTGDIGGKIVRGAHGPRRLAVVLYGPAGEA